MLLQVLQNLAQNDEVFSLPHLAHRLGIDQDLLREILDNLVQAGYLRAIGETCPQGCHECPMVTACLSMHPPKAWILTEKGMRFLMQTNKGRHK